MQDLRIYVISLAEANPRRAEFSARLRDLGLEFTIFDAIDGRHGLSEVAADEVDRPGALLAAQRQLSDAEFAAALSHRKVYEEFLASGADWALVFEDDAILDDRLLRFLDADGYRAAPLMLLHHLNARIFGDGISVDGSESLAFEPAVSPFRAAAYTLDRAFAKRLVDVQTPVRNIADWPLDIARFGARILVPEIVGHPEVSRENSALEGGRIKARSRSIRDFLNTAYLRRKWRKLRSRKVS